MAHAIYRSDPVSFVREVLGSEAAPWQRTALTVLQRGQPRLSFRSGMSVWYCSDCKLAYAPVPYCPRCGRPGIRRTC